MPAKTGGWAARKSRSSPLPSRSLRAEGIDATGPHPADTLFAPHKRGSYDVAIAMYHDQALVPLKTLDFDEGVNVTLGLPIVRTSPDHGTAFDIAGKGIARSRRDDRRDPDGRARLPHAGRRWHDPAAPARSHRARTASRAIKALGQNFLFDEQLLDRIAAIPGRLDGKAVLEVGPGPGGLTRALLRAGARVTAIEMDRRCLPALAELAEAFPGKLRVIEGDALKIDHGDADGRALRRRRQPALQCRHRAVHPLAGRARTGRRNGPR